MTFKYRPINGWTKARIIERLREKLPKDGSRAGFVNEDGAFMCCYRAPNGCCAAGSFIPDEQYDPSFENRKVTDLRVQDFMPLPMEAMWQLQHIHDINSNNTLERCVAWVEKNVKDKQ